MTARSWRCELNTRKASTGVGHRPLLLLAVLVLVTACGDRDDAQSDPEGAAPTSTPPQVASTGPELDQQTAQDRHLSSVGPDLATVPRRAGIAGQSIDPFELSAIDADSPCSALRFAAEGLPDGLTVTSEGDCTATVSGTISGRERRYVVTYRVTDEAGASDVSVGVFIVQTNG